MLDWAHAYSIGLDLKRIVASAVTRETERDQSAAEREIERGPIQVNETFDVKQNVPHRVCHRT